MSGIFVRCPNCDLEVKVELHVNLAGNITGWASIDPDFTVLAEHARNCAEENP